MINKAFSVFSVALTGRRLLLTALFLIAAFLPASSLTWRKTATGDSVFKILCVSAMGKSQEYTCKSYEEFNNRMILYLKSEDESNRILLNINNFVTIEIRKETPSAQSAQIE